MGQEEKNNLLRELAEHRATEFVDEGHKLIVKCSRCAAELVEIWVVRPDAPVQSEIIAECPHCGDQSFMKKVRGQYCIGQIESGKTIMIDTPTEMDTVDGQLLQKVRIKTAKGE
jgi:DNA-directed RNA polymerase subunit RPC12/RpoP